MSIGSISSGSVSYNVQQQIQGRPRINVIAGVWDKAEKFGSKNGSTIMIHPDFLRNMHDDPELEARYEKVIRDYAESNERGRKGLDDMGLRVMSSGLYIDENGVTEKNGVLQAYVTVAGKYARDDSGAAKTILGTAKVSKEEMADLRKRLDEERQSRLIEDPDPPAGDGMKSEHGDASFMVTVDTTA